MNPAYESLIILLLFNIFTQATSLIMKLLIATPTRSHQSIPITMSFVPSSPQLPSAQLPEPLNFREPSSLQYHDSDSLYVLTRYASPPKAEARSSPPPASATALWQRFEDHERESFDLERPHPYSGTRVRIICKHPDRFFGQMGLIWI